MDSWCLVELRTARSGCVRQHCQPSDDRRRNLVGEALPETHRLWLPSAERMITRSIRHMERETDSGLSRAHMAVAAMLAAMAAVLATAAVSRPLPESAAVWGGAALTAWCLALLPGMRRGCGQERHRAGAVEIGIMVPAVVRRRGRARQRVVGAHARACWLRRTLQRDPRGVADGCGRNRVGCRVFPGAPDHRVSGCPPHASAQPRLRTRGALPAYTLAAVCGRHGGAAGGRCPDWPPRLRW